MAVLALRLLEIDPSLGGIAIRARSGPVRQCLTQAFPANSVRLHPTMGDDVLTDGLDLSATLSQGKLVIQKGLLSTAGPLVLTMAERTQQHMAALLGQALDENRGHTLILLDEGTEDESAPTSLTERLAFAVDLNSTAVADAVLSNGHGTQIADVDVPGDLIEKIAIIAGQFGVQSARASIFTLRAARAIAALEQHGSITDDDLRLACQLTLSHRATQIPEQEAPEQEEASDTEPQSETEQPETDDENLSIPDELLLDAVLANLPPNLLAQLQSNTRTGKGSGSGAKQRGNRRGRPLPSRSGKKTDGARIDIIATLRSAAPWQTIRAKQTGRSGIHIRSSDIQIKRFEDRSDRLLIFAVDASGSAALSRLAEAKGAVELLLAEAYARRDHVALVAFRGESAETLLPPTRSLVQTKRRLAALPGGGGTPLAAGMEAALQQALHAKRKGMSPTVCILTDGRANIARDGRADRVQAASDAQDMARVMRANGVDSLVIDTGNRPEPKLRDLATTLDATYLPLPRAKAERLCAAVSAALDT